MCAENNVPVLVNSDAHSEFEVGEVRRALEMLDKIHFPEDLIINTDGNRTERYVSSGI